MFRSTKTYGQEQGLSCAFRQWRANHSHCQLLHGYAFGFKFIFGAHTLDNRGWVMDFGSLKVLKELLKESFDHRVAIAGDDPELFRFLDMHESGVINLKVFPHGVGVERFAEYAHGLAVEALHAYDPSGWTTRGLHVVSCECSEHAGNSAIYTNTVCPTR